ncbi:MAG: 30S ribosomal protein S6 [Phycisphaerae bacterium]|nr:MAG: 30S ribosomal protein S6 [Planctomycetota bacterium]KAB2936794.1 MAG: 30S ribosomal protein S6 [Phycisphaerae bacterium]MBE7455801.1 30S ribosomal protein S6 [Planctomycetia bacterium]MCK6463436.1 30S ribosomal protein S6 [Phycisphaerae bacterium]MCL4717058.1 30S ribosomal protein S6 [Phycisphaerae bacterium]
MDKLNQYEAMFLFDPTFATSDQAPRDEIKRLLDRAEAQDVAMARWDERRLAYRIKGRKRAAYYLAYFKASGTKVAGLERDIQLSEAVLRALVLRADHVTPERMQDALKGAPKETPRSAEDGFGGGGRFGGRRDRFESAPDEAVFAAVPELE